MTSTSMRRSLPAVYIYTGLAVVLGGLFCFTPRCPAELLAHWAFDGDLEEPEGGYNGIFFGAEEPTFVEGFDGAEDGAIALDGVDDYVQAESSEVLLISDNFTLALWFRPESLTQSQKYLLSRNGGGGQYAIIFEYTDDRIDFFAPTREFGDDPRANAMSEMPLTTLGWHHIAYTYDGAVWSGYLDGEQVFETDIEFVLDTLFVAPWYIGAANPSANHVQGAIDEVRIYDEALGLEDVEELAAGAIVPECPAEGDTRCDGLEVAAPEVPGPGIYTFTATGTDDSGDTELFYAFEAVAADGRTVARSPQAANTAGLGLGAGTWTVTVTVHDDLLCQDEAEGATCSTVVEVEAVEVLLAHWALDGDLEDSAGSNPGIFFGDEEPTFVEGQDGEEEGAIRLDGIDDYIQIPHADELALSDSFTLALWFRSEFTDQFQKYLLSRNDSIAGGSGKQYAIIFEYTDDRVDFYAPSRLSGDDPRANAASEMPLEDTEWHHIAYTYDGSVWSGYIDGEAIFSVETDFVLDNTFASSWWIGAANLDVAYTAGDFADVRMYSYALDAEAIDALASGVPAAALFRRGDVDGNGTIDVTDPINNLTFQFLGTFAPGCLDALDFDDSGAIDVTDPVGNLNAQFLGGPPAPAPGSAACGEDPTPDALACETYQPASCQ